MIEGLPWGIEELHRFKAFLAEQVGEMEAGRGRVLAGTSLQASEVSENSYKISIAKGNRMRTNISIWWPTERVTEDHKAEAVRIVYTGMLAAGVVPWQARRRERVGFVG